VYFTLCCQRSGWEKATIRKELKKYKRKKCLGMLIIFEAVKFGKALLWQKQNLFLVVLFTSWQIIIVLRI
jgi:hypothetical protein